MIAPQQAETEIENILDITPLGIDAEITWASTLFPNYFTDQKNYFYIS